MKLLNPTGRQGLIFCLLIVSTFGLRAQITASSNDTFIIPAGDTLYVNGLGFYPDSLFNLTGISILESTTLLNSSSNNHINKVFSFAPTAPSFSGVLGFRYNESDLNGIPEADLQLNFFNTTWTRATSDSFNTLSNYLISSPLNTLPKELTLASRLSALPLEWLSIQATPKEKNIKVLWTTAQEDQVQAYTIFHSPDTKHWTALGALKAQGHLYNQYEFVHVQPSSGDHFYRIQETGLDGNKSISKIAFINTDPKLASLKIFPNPSAKGSITLTLATASTIRIYQSNGVLVYVQNLKAGAHVLSTLALRSGTYMVTDGMHPLIWVIQ